MEEVVCWGCINDPYLIAEIRSDGITARCSFCSRRRKCLNIEWLADKVAEVLDEHIRQGDHDPVWDDERDRIDHYQQDGDPLSYWVTEVLHLEDEDDPVVSSVVELLGPSHYDVMQGGEGRFDPEASYVRWRRRPVETEEKWQSFRSEIMHGRRFFNDKAKPFLDWLFQGLAVAKKSTLFYQASVVQNLATDTLLFRARQCDSLSALEKILQVPEKELGPPPKELAGAQRMSPAGVPFFYGAFERDTCIAELRPATGATVVSGQFRPSRPLTVFDFVSLEAVYLEHPASYFDSGYSESIERELFLETLHGRISSPVLPKAEQDYLTTQVIAEYLASQFPTAIDGVIFRSAQHDAEDARNIALFPHALPHIELVPNSLQVHQVQRVKYRSNTRSVHNGMIETFAEDYEDYDFNWS